MHVGSPVVAMQLRCLALLLALVQQSYPAAVATKTVDEVGNFTIRTVFTPGEGRYAAFRIPGIVASSGSGGSVLHMFAEARKYSCADFHGQTDIVYKRSTDAGLSFSPLKTLLDPVKLFGAAQCPPQSASNTNDCCAFWDPTPLVTRTGKVIVMAQRSWNHRITPKQNESSKDSRLMGFMDNWVLHSTDDGLSFTAPKNITSQVWSDAWHVASTSNGHGLQTSSGRLIMPVYVHPTEQFLRFPQAAMRSAIYYSDDDGEHWHFPNTSLVGIGTSESEIVELPVTAGGSGGQRQLLFNHRRNDLCGGRTPCPFSKTEHTRYQSLSTDNGLTFFNFSAVEALPDPGCKGGVIAWPTSRYPAGMLLTNAASATARQDITLRWSPDGKTWPPAAKQLLSVPAGYSDVALLSSGQRDLACVLFEAPQCGPIKLAVVDPSTFLPARH